MSTSQTTGSITFTLFDPKTHVHLLPSFVQIHIDCITHSHTVASFLPPLDRDALTTYWTSKVDEVRAGKRDIILALAPGTDGDGDDGVLAGYVMLADHRVQAAPTAGVEKLLVSLDFRRRGVARKLIVKLEEIAWSKGLTSLVLDTEEGSTAELIYLRFGYTAFGKIPNHAISPKDGSKKTLTYFYKHLEDGRLEA
ncbi:acyl-CoA N-acyltransferase [Coniophora puteana RWD-64-598 SS2]|uniref:Acyl-CoA N-acyltransferase n=1 Tax=Coniophora puteana (strain RWD-64-598) TaxID=741705 RepID=A0A5M3MIZ4_CONPW|nr:acyl-CoA N-acyltransferase [Coniophora puteana RWD-64-598 SS2]EIW79218.1 acyl-CoA N-acyltransferase [Coniophora puteana RWD-64-598 SS2]